MSSAPSDSLRRRPRATPHNLDATILGVAPMLRSDPGLDSATTLAKPADPGRAATQLAGPPDVATVMMRGQAKVPAKHAAPTVIAPAPSPRSEAATVLAPIGSLDLPPPQAATMIAPGPLPFVPAAPAPFARMMPFAPAIARADAGQWPAYVTQPAAVLPDAKPTRSILGKTFRVVRFLVLTSIVLGALGYGGLLAFYSYNEHWLVPATISPTDDKVVALQGQLAAMQHERDKLAGELAHTDAAIAAEQTFQLAFAKAIQNDLESRQAALARVRQLAQRATAARAELGDVRAQATASDPDADQADLSSSSAELQQREAEFKQHAADLAVQTKALDSMLAQQSSASSAGYDIAKIQRDYDVSKRELAKNVELRSHSVASLARQDQMLADLRQSALLRAVTDHVAVALVPSTASGHAEKGAALYACRAELVGCRQIGTVLDVLPGDFQVKQPHRDRQLRAQMIEMQLTDASASEADVLFVGSKPLGF